MTFCKIALLFGLAVAIVATTVGSDLAPMRVFAKAAPPADAGRDARPDKSQFIRFNDDGKGGGTLETAIATYRKGEGDDAVVVHLVAAIHVGERAYFDELAKTFEAYDALLYELVKPKDGAVPGSKQPVRPGGTRIRGAAAVGGLQSLLKNALNLEFQLEAMNYDRPNFIHADLDAETFNKLQEERGESLPRLMLRSMMQEMKRQAAGKGAPAITLFDVLAAMRSPDSARQYKLLLARQFTNIDATFEGLEGREGSVLVTERNKAALKVLKQTIADGKKTIGVFYGAGHMRGIEKELTGEMGFKAAGIEWRKAWDMTAPVGADGHARKDVKATPK